MTPEQAAETLRRYLMDPSGGGGYVFAKAALAVLVERNQRLEAVAGAARDYLNSDAQLDTAYLDHALAALDAEEHTQPKEAPHARLG